MNRVTIYSIMTLKVLPATCFRYNSEEISSKFPTTKIKLNTIDMNFPVQVL